MEILDLRWSNASFLFMCLNITLSALFFTLCFYLFPFLSSPARVFSISWISSRVFPVSTVLISSLSSWLPLLRNPCLAGRRRKWVMCEESLISDEFSCVFLPFKGEIFLSHPGNLTGRTALASNKGKSSEYIGPSLVFVLLCLSHVQTGRLQLFQLVFLKIKSFTTLRSSKHEPAVQCWCQFNHWLWRWVIIDSIWCNFLL